MDANEQLTARGSDAVRGKRRSLPRRVASLISRLVLIATVVSIMVAGLGFVRFMQEVEGYRGRAVDGADGIVVLTGGKDRIDAALRLLADAKGRRLLISGVHPQTSGDAIRLTVASGAELFDCCVDIDHALDTQGNAEETAKWARFHDFSSMIVVTSDYHMPRSLLLMRETMPKARIVPHAVHSDENETEDGVANSDSLRVVLTEYLKYLAARAGSVAPKAAGN